MTTSTTNTAARELPSNDHLRLHLGEMTAQEMRTAKAAYRLALTETLTQQQGGEQEVAWQSIETAEAEFLTNLADKGGLADPVPGMLRHCARLIAGKRPAVVAPDRYETEEEGDAYAHGYVDGEDAALRSKQPAASEGEAVDSTFAEWLASEMPAGTVIGDPMWWANRIARQYQVRCTPRHPADEGMAMQWPRGVLNRDKTLELLISHNEWRRGKEGPQTDPRLLGLALEATIAALQAGPRERGAAGGGK